MSSAGWQTRMIISLDWELDAGGEDKFVENNPQTPTAVNTELQQLLVDLHKAPTRVERQWRLLRKWWTPIFRPLAKMEKLVSDRAAYNAPTDMQ